MLRSNQLVRLIGVPDAKPKKLPMRVSWPADMGRADDELVMRLREFHRGWGYPGEDADEGGRHMIPIFAMTFLALVIVLGFGVPVVMAQTEHVPQGIAEWAAGFGLWIVAGGVIILIGVYGWLILYALANRERLVRLESWRDATEERLASGKGSMEDLRGDIAMATLG